MALTIEDGSVVTGADSFATVAEARAYASARGVTLSATDGDVEILLRKAADFLNSLEEQFKGERVDPLQSLVFPREGVYLFASTTEFPDDEIPELLKTAQCQLAVDAVATTLQPNGSGREVLEERVEGAVTVRYAERGSGSITPELNKAMGILAPLFKSGGGFALTTIRV